MFNFSFTIFLRPSGRHAGPSGPKSSCFFNNAAIAANYALSKHGASRVAVLDFDQDVGGGSIQGFRNNNKCFYGSVYRFGEARSHKGVIGERIVNKKIEKRSDFQSRWSEVLEEMVKFKPSFVIISAGFGFAVKIDEYLESNLDEYDFKWATTEVFKACHRIDTSHSIPVVSVLEGYYNNEELGKSLNKHIDALQVGYDFVQEATKFLVGDRVETLDSQLGRWCPGEITSDFDDNSYDVDVHVGIDVRRRLVKKRFRVESTQIRVPELCLKGKCFHDNKPLSPRLTHEDCCFYCLGYCRYSECFEICKGSSKRCVDHQICRICLEEKRLFPNIREKNYDCCNEHWRCKSCTRNLPIDGVCVSCKQCNLCNKNIIGSSCANCVNKCKFEKFEYCLSSDPNSKSWVPCEVLKIDHRLSTDPNIYIYDIEYQDGSNPSILKKVCKVKSDMIRSISGSLCGAEAEFRDGNHCCLDHIKCSECDSKKISTYRASFVLTLKKYLCKSCNSVNRICQRDNNDRDFHDIMEQNNWDSVYFDRSRDFPASCENSSDPSSKNLELCKGCFVQVCGVKRCKSLRINDSNFCRYHTYKCSSRGGKCDNEKTTNQNDKDLDNCKGCQICRFPVVDSISSGSVDNEIKRNIKLCADFKDNCKHNKSHICVYRYLDDTRCKNEKMQKGGKKGVATHPDRWVDWCIDHQWCIEKDCCEFCLSNSRFCQKHSKLSGNEILKSLRNSLHLKLVILGILFVILSRRFGNKIGCWLQRFIYTQDEDDYENCITHLGGGFVNATFWTTVLIICALFYLLWVDKRNKAATKGQEEKKMKGTSEANMKFAQLKDISDKDKAKKEFDDIARERKARDKEEVEKRKIQTEEERRRAKEKKLKEEKDAEDVEARFRERSERRSAHEARLREDKDYKARIEKERKELKDEIDKRAKEEERREIEKERKKKEVYDALSEEEKAREEVAKSKLGLKDPRDVLKYNDEWNDLVKAIYGDLDEEKYNRMIELLSKDELLRFINEQDKNGVNAVMVAAGSGKYKYLRTLLLERGARVDSVNAYGYDAIHLAYLEGYDECAVLLKSKKENLSTPSPCSSRLGSYECEEGLSPRIRNQKFGTCFAHALSRCLTRLIQMAYYPKYESQAKCDWLYDSLVRSIVTCSGKIALSKGGCTKPALESFVKECTNDYFFRERVTQFCKDNAFRVDKNVENDEYQLSESFLVEINDLRQIILHLDLKFYDYMDYSVQQLKDAVNDCRRPVYSIFARNKTLMVPFSFFFPYPIGLKEMNKKLILESNYFQEYDLKWCNEHAEENDKISDYNFEFCSHGGHAMCARRYDADNKCFEVDNSWGEGFADKGRYRVSEKDVLNHGPKRWSKLSVAEDLVFKDSLPMEFKANVDKFIKAHTKNVHLSTEPQRDLRPEGCRECDDTAQPEGIIRCCNGFEVKLLKDGPFASGNTAEIFDGVACDDGSPVVLKKFTEDYQRSWGAAMERELEVLQTCCSGPERSRNLHAYFGHRYQRKGRCSIVLEKVGQTDLKELLGKAPNDKARCDELEFANACQTVLSVCDGLQALHDAGFIHCDLGLENIRVDTIGARGESTSFTSSKIIDFGRCARIEEATPLFGGGVWELMPREQWQGRVSPTTDVQTAAALLVLLLTGTAPFYPGDELFLEAHKANSWDFYKSACRKKSWDRDHLSSISEGHSGAAIFSLIEKGLKGEFPTAKVFSEELKRFLRPRMTGELG
jgi:serine/threonine protein kinase